MHQQIGTAGSLVERYRRFLRAFTPYIVQPYRSSRPPTLAVGYIVPFTIQFTVHGTLKATTFVRGTRLLENDVPTPRFAGRHAVNWPV